MSVHPLKLALVIELFYFGFSPQFLEAGEKSPQGYEKQPVAKDLSNTWRLSGGYQWRQIGDLHFDTGSAASTFPLPWLAGPGGRSSSIAMFPGNISFDQRSPA